jgi:hypothetical protein
MSGNRLASATFSGCCDAYHRPCQRAASSLKAVDPIDVKKQWMQEVDRAARLWWSGYLLLSLGERQKKKVASMKK